MTDLASAMNLQTPAKPEAEAKPARKPRTRKAAAKRAAPAKKKKRKAKKAKAAKAAAKPNWRTATSKLSLQDALDLTQSLRRPDLPPFDTIVGVLSSKPKASRRRILVALSKVFG